MFLRSDYDLMAANCEEIAADFEQKAEYCRQAAEASLSEQAKMHHTRGAEGYIKMAQLQREEAEYYRSVYSAGKTHAERTTTGQV